MSRAGLTFRFPEKAEPYAAALRAAGIEPVLLSPDSPCLLDGLDGLCLSGGTDLDPASYGQHPAPETEAPDLARDAMEWDLLHKALAADLPVLAICRGFQLFNVIHGGALRQHAEGHRARWDEDPPGAHREVHKAAVRPGTKLAAIVGWGEYGVNSRHHQVIAGAADGLTISAIAPDGVIEGLERPDLRFALAVQWHPEDRVLVADGDRRLFEAFGAAMRTK